MKKQNRKILLSYVTIILFVASGLFFLSFFEVSAQRGKKVQTVRKTYGRFDHDTAAHRKQSCNECHKAPNGFSNSETDAGEKYRYPDINDYPTHDSCIDCHRQQFFKGNRPEICSVCHTKVSPRDKARFDFPAPNRTGEFAIRFPHNVHQDIIAQNEFPAFRQNNIVSPHFVNVKFPTETKIADDKRTDYNNCAICHMPAKGKVYDTDPRRPQLVALENGIVIATHREKVTVPAGFFKTLPTGHDSCFNCHYSEQKPTRNDCAGCHIPQSGGLADPNIVERLSLKFNHEQKTENGTYPHDKECASCHLRITQSANLRTLDPDVPIFTCASKGTGCHADEIKLEVDKRGEDLVKRQANAQHQIQSCSYCHGGFVGSHQIPESHKGIKP